MKFTSDVYRNTMHIFACGTDNNVDVTIMINMRNDKIYDLCLSLEDAKEMLHYLKKAVDEAEKRQKIKYEEEE